MEEGTITIRTFNLSLRELCVGYEVIDPGNYVVIQVSDQGQGIEKKDLERVFEPFFTKKDQTSHSGTGLGLAVVYGIVKDHRGFLDVRSQLGQGTTFELYIPALRQAKEKTM